MLAHQTQKQVIEAFELVYPRGLTPIGMRVTDILGAYIRKYRALQGAEDNRVDVIKDLNREIRRLEKSLASGDGRSFLGKVIKGSQQPQLQKKLEEAKAELKEAEESKQSQELKPLNLIAITDGVPSTSLFLVVYIRYSFSGALCQPTI